MNLRKFKTAIIFFFAIATFCANISDAQEWARRMFKEYVHDFKKVPLGEIPEYRFEIQNIYEEDIRIRSISSSCGCTIASASKNVLKTWEKGEIICRFNSPAVGPGFKQATVTVRFDRPFVGETQLTVRGTIVSGVSFTPETIEFGQVTNNSSKKKSVRITSAGNPNLQIVDVKSKFDHITVYAPQKVSAIGSNVVYELTAELKSSVPKGYSQGELYVIVEENPNIRGPNNTRILRQIPVKFNAKVAAPLQLAPDILQLGKMNPGSRTTQKVVLSSETAFKITDVRCQSNAFSVKADPEAKKFHIVEISYVGVPDVGLHENELSFYTDLNSSASGKMKAVVEIVNGESGDSSEGG